MRMGAAMLGVMATDPDAEAARHAAIATLAAITGGDTAQVAAVAARLEPVRYRDGAVLVRQGDPPERFAVIIDGRVAIHRERDGVVRELAEAGPGSIIGEIAMLRGSPRAATATARGGVRALLGGPEVFAALFALPGAASTLTAVAARRLAANASPIAATTPGGLTVHVRPLLPSDREDLAEAISAASERTLRMRFFTAGRLPPSVIDYLVDLDFVDHFAWVATDDEERGAGISRYVRDRERGDTAEFAVAVADAHQRKGVGSLLLGAIAAAAGSAGIHTFTGDVRADNRPMISLLNGLGARWAHSEPGVNTATVPVDAMRALIGDGLAVEITEVANGIRSAATAPHVHAAGSGG
jgi:CRP-like cAMP-binding protein